MKQYLDALQHVLDNGQQVGDRTGVGTISCFGMQQRYDLSESFPAPTLWLNPEITDITKFTMQDMRLDNYVSHGPIRAEMAV